MVKKMKKLERENQQLEAKLKVYMGEDLSSVNSMGQLTELGMHLKSTITKVNAKKCDMLINGSKKLQVKIDENERHDDAAAAGVEMEESTMAEPPLPQSEKSAGSET